MKVYGELITVKEVLQGMGFLASEIGESGKDEQGSFTEAGKPDETAITNLKAKPGINNVQVEEGELRRVFCDRFEH